MTQSTQTRSVADVRAFVAELVTPIDPWVFAGFGSPTQKRLLDAPDDEERIIREWLSQSDREQLLDALMELAGDPALTQSYVGIEESRREGWLFVLADLIYRLCADDEAELRRIVAALRERNVSKQREIADNLALWAEEEFEHRET